MFELSEEQLLMSAPDNTVRLTTHRIIFESPDVRQQVMREDFISYQFFDRSFAIYLVLLLLFIIPFTGFFINKVIDWFELSADIRKQYSFIYFTFGPDF